MVNKHGYSENSDNLQAQAAQELVQMLWQDETIYPWNPLAPESEAYLVELEQELGLDDWLEAEVKTRSHSFFAQIDQLWPQNVPAPALQRLQDSLARRFAERAPQAWLEAIATRATEMMRGTGRLAPSLSLMDQMVQCVEQLLPNWAEEDLQVLARPLAYAMRGAEAEAVDLTLGAVRPIDWTQLSEMEQARLTLAIARYALAELETAND
jgi:hypothetical protein